jgi:uncharacterized protein YbjT (DUF2867 family)
MVALAVVVAILAWLYASGIEPDHVPAQLAVLSKEPGAGAVLVIGGTRGTGLEVVKVLRTRGDDVIVLARPDSDASGAEKLGARIVRGNAMNLPDLKAALAGSQVRAVVSTLGARTVKEPRPDFQGNRNAIDAAKEAGVKRFVLVTVIGAGDSLPAAPWFARRFLKNVINDKTQAESYLAGSGLDYTIIRPGGLLDKEAQGRAYLTEDHKAMGWIRRGDLALLVVQALDDPGTHGKTYHAIDPERTRFWSLLRG